MLGINENELPGLREAGLPKAGHQRVELFLSCRNLRNRDKLSLSDPQIVVYSVDKKSKLSRLGATEVIKDDLHPDFTKTIQLDFVFEIVQGLHFEIKDIDDEKGGFDPLGTVDTTLGDIMGARNQLSIYDIKLDNKPAGKLVIRAEIVDGSPSFVVMKVEAEKLWNPNGCCDSIHPFFRISRVIGENSMVVVYESRFKKGTANPKWASFELSIQTLSNNDEHRPLKFDVWHKSGSFNANKKLIGEATFTISNIKEKNLQQFRLRNPKNKNADVGTLLLSNFKIIQKPTFLEYLRGGIQLNVIVCIDYTQSNGHPSDIKSLHSLKLDGQNDYQKAISSVCQILLCYDYDKKVNMYGFGGFPKYSKEVSHCFPLCGQSDDDNEAHGLDGIMSAYENSLKDVKLGGPTFFKKIIRKGIDHAKREQQNGDQIYTIQLILTDGMIHDMADTIDCLVEASELPLSVIVVGVGNEDFKKMEDIDSDDKMLVSSRGVTAKRDIVQFVPFNQYQWNKDKLAEEVLAEVPRQFLDYMAMQKILPKEKPEANIDNIQKVDQAEKPDKREKRDSIGPRIALRFSHRAMSQDELTAMSSHQADKGEPHFGFREVLQSPNDMNNNVVASLHVDNSDIIALPDPDKKVD